MPQCPPEALQSLLSKGVIAGAGSVVVFLPQILILFFFIAILEDCGYMARAAYLMDRLMVRVGLSGKSFIPLLSSFACAIPGVMATRVIENRRDRLTTILVAPLMSCSARLPVYTLLIGAFIPARTYLGGWLGLQGLTLFAMYLVGIVTAVFVALVLKKTLLRGATPPFVMELPPYKIPSLGIVLHRMLERGWSFVRRAGTLIVAVAIVVWALLYFPHNSAKVADDLAPGRRNSNDSSRRRRMMPRLLRTASNSPPNWAVSKTRLSAKNSKPAPISGKAVWHRWAAGSSRPCGRWVGTGGLAVRRSRRSRPAKLCSARWESSIILVKTSMFTREGQTQLQAELRRATWDGTDRPVFTVPVALSLMVFFALCASAPRRSP